MPEPEVCSPGQWPGVLRRTCRHITQAENIAPLTDQQAEAVLEYLKQASRPGAGADAAPR